MLNTTERILFLRKVPLFTRLGLPGQSQIAAVAEEAAFAPAEMLFRQGDPADSLYVLLDGEVAILLDGHEVNRMRPGDSFGEVAILDRGTRTAGARAVGDVLTLRIDRAAISDLLASSAELRLAVVDELASRIRGIQDRIRAMGGAVMP